MHERPVLLDQIVRQQGDTDAALTRAHDAEDIVDRERGLARALSIAGDLDQPAPVLEMIGHDCAAEQQKAVIVEIVQGARRAESFDVFRRGIGVEPDREQLALDQIGRASCRERV